MPVCSGRSEGAGVMGVAVVRVGRAVMSWMWWSIDGEYEPLYHYHRQRIQLVRSCRLLIYIILTGRHASHARTFDQPAAGQ